MAKQLFLLFMLLLSPMAYAQDQDQDDNEALAEECAVKAYEASLDGDLENARVFYEMATELKPDYRAVYHNWGIVLSKLAQQNDDEELLNQAIQKFEKAIELDPDDAKSYHNWGVALYFLSQLNKNTDLLTESISKFVTSTNINSDDALVYSNWGAVMVELAKVKQNKNLLHEGIGILAISIDLDPDNALAYNNWGSALLDLIKMTGVQAEYKEQILEKLLKAEELKQGEASYNLACFYSVYNDIDNSFLWLEHALKDKRETRKHIEQDTDLDNIRQDPRYEELLNLYYPL